MAWGGVSIFAATSGAVQAAARVPYRPAQPVGHCSVARSSRVDGAPRCDMTQHSRPLRGLRGFSEGTQYIFNTLLSCDAVLLPAAPQCDENNSAFVRPPKRRKKKKNPGIAILQGRGAYFSGVDASAAGFGSRARRESSPETRCYPPTYPFRITSCKSCSAASDRRFGCCVAEKP